MIPLSISHSFASVFASMRSGDRNKEMELFYLHGTKYCSYRNAKIGQYYSCVTNIPGRTHFLHSFGSLRMTSRDLYFCQLGARKGQGEWISGCVIELGENVVVLKRKREIRIWKDNCAASHLLQSLDIDWKVIVIFFSRKFDRWTLFSIAQ